MRYLFLLGCLLYFACESVVDDPAFAVTPRIELVGVNTTTLVQFQDTLRLTLAYEDGDGDLGTSDPDVNLVTVRDDRLPEADTYYLPPLAPEGTTVSIQGEIILELPPLFLLGNGSQEAVMLTVTLTDRAGNMSNAVAVEIAVIR